MSFFTKRLLVLLLACFVTVSAWASDGFLVHRIEVNGLQRVSQGTVLNYLPIQIGQYYNSQDSSGIIESLYKTGFFSNVSLSRRGHTLIVTVKERPTIGLISIKGNKAISSKKLNPVLKKLGIVEGNVFSSEKLNEITQGLEQEYDILGHYAVKIETKVVQEPRNRVAIYIQIHEGPTAIVRKITIIGSHNFSTHYLLKNFKLSTPGLFTIFTHSDRYSKLKLEQSLDNLQKFYFNHGYLEFRVLAQHVTISPDHRKVYIEIHIHEGPVFRVSGYRIDAKPEIANNPHIHQLIQVKPGTIFSRKQIVKIDGNIAHYFADHGYAFPNIRVLPKLNNKAKTVFLIFQIHPGDIVYVNQIHIFGNTRTEDKVIRREMHQYEGSVFSLKKIDESKRRIANLPYLRNITVVPVHVPGKPDKVDLDYHVKEVNAGRASINGGYGTDEGFLYGASISEPNVMGTGNYASVSFRRSQISTNYSVSYINPFLTISGVSQGVSLYYTSTNSNRSKQHIDDSYNIDTFGGHVDFGIPVSNYDTLTMGTGYDHVAIKSVNLNRVSPCVLSFLLQHGFIPSRGNTVAFNQLSATGGWTRTTLDRAVFPTKGSLQRFDATLGVPVAKSSLGYYKLTYHGIWFFPLGHGFIISPHTQLGYGNGFGSTRGLPFIYNFYAGGINTLPGFAPNSLGPRNLANNNTALGGNVEILGGISFIFPNFISDKIRTAVIFNFGNIFQTERVGPLPNVNFPIGLISPRESVSIKNFRTSIGVEISWYSPIGLLHFSVATALNKKRGDDTQLFGFSFGTSL